MKFSAILLTVLIGSFVGCASIHSGNYAEQVDDNPSSSAKSHGNTEKVSRLGLLISGEENNGLSSEHFCSIDFTFENKTDKWIRINKVNIDFGNKDVTEKINIPIGRDLGAWAEAAKQQQAIKDYNTNMILSGITAAGGAAFAISNDNTVRTSGGLVALTGLTASSIRSRLTPELLGKLLPSSHLLAEDFIVPPGLHAKKWITLYTERPYDIPYIETIYLTYRTTEGKEERVRLNFRSHGFGISDWQRNHPELKEREKKAREKDEKHNNS